MKNILFLMILLVFSLDLSAQYVSDYAGNGSYNYSQNGTISKNAEIGSPYGIAVDAKQHAWFTNQSGAYICGLIDGKFYKRAGGGYRYIDGRDTVAGIGVTYGITTASDGTIYFIDGSKHAVRRLSKFVQLDTPQYVTTIAGGDTGYADGIGSKALFYGVFGIALLNDSTAVVTDIGNALLRKVDLKTGRVTTIAGTLKNHGYHNDDALFALIGYPSDIAVHNGKIYFYDGDGDLRVLDNGKVSTVIIDSFPGTFAFVNDTEVYGAGYQIYSFNLKSGLKRRVAGFNGGHKNGPALQAQFGDITSLAKLNDSTCLVSDPMNFRIRVMSPQLYSGIEEYEQPLVNGSLSVWPNPAREEVNVRLAVAPATEPVEVPGATRARGTSTGSAAAAPRATIMLLDMNGRVVETRASTTLSMTTMDISQLPKGIYIIKAQNADGVSVGRVVKE